MPDKTPNPDLDAESTEMIELEELVRDQDKARTERKVEESSKKVNQPR